MRQDQHNGHNGDAAHVAPLLEAFHAGTLPATTAATVERHLRACPTCQEQSADIALYRLIRAASAPSVGPELRERVYARIAAESAPATTSPRAISQSALRERSVKPRAALPPYAYTALPGRGWLSGAVAVVIVALLAGVLWGLPRVRNGAPATNTPSPTSQTCATGGATKLPTNTYISDIAMATANEGWAVGQIDNSQGVATQALLLRFSACQLTRYTLDLPSVALISISMDSPTDGWAVGSNQSTLAPVLLHYSAGAWQQVSLPRQAPAQGAFDKIKMRAANEGWIILNGIKDSHGMLGYGLLHDINGAWSSVACPLSTISDIAPVGPNDLWVTGAEAGGPKFAHYHNDKWSVTPQPKGIGLDTLHAVSPTDIWANGQGLLNSPDVYPAIAHFDGSSWQVVSHVLPSGAGQGYEVFILGDSEGWGFHITMTSHSPPDLTPDTSVTSVLRETNGQWQALIWPYKDIVRIYSWAPTSSGDIWVVGEYMTFTATGGNSSVGLGQSVLLHYANGVWTRYG